MSTLALPSSSSLTLYDFPAHVQAEALDLKREFEEILSTGAPARSRFQDLSARHGKSVGRLYALLKAWQEQGDLALVDKRAFSRLWDRSEDVGLPREFLEWAPPDSPLSARNSPSTMEPSSTQPSAFKSQVSQSSSECGVLIDKATGHPVSVFLDIQEGALHAKRGSGKMLAIVPVVVKPRKSLTKTRKEKVLKEIRDLRAIIRASGESIDGSIDKVTLRSMSALDTAIEIIKESDL